MRTALLIALLLLPLPSFAQEAEIPLPRPRPERPAAEVEVEAPKPEIAGEQPAAEAQPEVSAPAETTAVPAAEGEVIPPEGEVSAEPAQPARVYQTACPAVMMGLVEATILPPVNEGGCVEQSPLSLTGVLVNGRMVPVSGGVTTNCAMATALPQWLADVDGYLWSHDNLRIAEVNIGTSLMCRNVVGGSSAERLSEHSFANALDVIGFTLSDGRKISVAAGWNATEAEGRSVLRYAHDAACSIFMTTLGPEANAAHADHLHLDYGCHGKTCTARMCE